MAIRHTNRGGSLLEEIVRSLTLLKFVVFENNADAERAKEDLPERYVIRNFPHDTLYGTRGKKEALIVSSFMRGNWIRDNDGKFRCVMEAKFQDGSGSVDEKFPYLIEACRVSPAFNWIVVVGGRWWKIGRGLAAVEWLSDAAKNLDGRRLVVARQSKGFFKLAKEIWG